MKNILFLLFVILSSSVIAQDTGLKVVYKQEQKIAYIKSLSLPRETMKSLIRKAKQEPDKFVLEIKNGMSYYYPIAGNVFTHNYKNYFLKQAYTVLENDLNMDEPFAAKRDFNTYYEWDVDKSKTQVILGYKCYRAVSEKGIVAWFSTELNYPDGPVNYSGLSGLILQIETKSQIITAVEIVDDAIIDFKAPLKFHIVSFAKLRQRRISHH